MRILGFACVLIFLMILTNAILQTYGRELIPIFTVIAGGVTKVTMNYFLVGTPEINIKGAPISTLSCYTVIVTLNLIFVWVYSPRKPRYAALFLKPLAASAIMGGAAWAAYGFLSRLISGGGAVAFPQNAICTFLSIGVGALVYCVLVIALGILRAEDLRGVPHGQTLIRVLRLR